LLTDSLRRPCSSSSSSWPSWELSPPSTIVVWESRLPPRLTTTRWPCLLSSSRTFSRAAAELTHYLLTQTILYIAVSFGMSLLVVSFLPPTGPLAWSLTFHRASQVAWAFFRCVSEASRASSTLPTASTNTVLPDRLSTLRSRSPSGSSEAVLLAEPLESSSRKCWVASRLLERPKVSRSVPLASPTESRLGFPTVRPGE